MLYDMLRESFSNGKNISVLALIVLCIFVTVHMSVLTHLSVAATRLHCSFLTEKKSF